MFPTLVWTDKGMRAFGDQTWMFDEATSRMMVEQGYAKRINSQGEKMETAGMEPRKAADLRNLINRPSDRSQEQDREYTLNILRLAIESLEIREQQIGAMLAEDRIDPKEIRSRDEQIQSLQIQAMKIESERNALAEVVKLMTDRILRKYRNGDSAGH
jgi:hypothetical protein